MDKVTRGLQVLNQDLGQSKWCFGNSLTLADIAVGCMLGYVQLRFSAVINLESEYPNLKRLNKALLTRQSFQDSIPQA
jgi:glutathione S-transferase